jgi:CubicO group peptidase (beta-lactamase class C family)
MTGTGYALLAAQQPSWEPGTAHGESALFYGHLVGELVRRVDGRGVGRFLAEEICGPAGLDFAFGLCPAQQARTVDLTGLDDAFRAGNAAGRPALYQLATTNPPGAQDGAVVSSAAWRAAEIPAVNGHGTAAAVAGFYHALAAGELLSPGLLAEAVNPQCAGPDKVFGDDNAWGLGFGISDDGYGMGGLGGSYGGASTAGGYTIGFVTGSVGSHDRVDTLETRCGNAWGWRRSRPPATRLRAAEVTPSSAAAPASARRHVDHPVVRAQARQEPAPENRPDRRIARQEQ